MKGFTGSCLSKSPDSSLCGYTAWLLKRSRTPGSRMAILPGAASRNDRREGYILSWKNFVGVKSRSPVLIKGWFASMKGPA
jgi:hypothetical protein